MKEKSQGAVAIIGGADGPTSVFVVGRKKGVSLKQRLRNRIYKWKSRRVAKRITAGERSLAEVVAYAVTRYAAKEVNATHRKYVAQKICLKDSLVRRYQLELPGELLMDFHLYEVDVDDGRLEMEIDYRWKVFGISYSGSKKTMKRMKEIAKDLYLYYGVFEEDIRKKTERYQALLAALSI